MKYSAIPIYAALLVSLFTGCSKSVGTVQVISAVYGSGTNFADVSVQVGGLIQLGTGFNADPHWLQADPNPGWNKTLVIVYEVRGQRHIFTAGEGDPVNTTILKEASKP
jgi:hypothetical protein